MGKVSKYIMSICFLPFYFHLIVAVADVVVAVVVVAACVLISPPFVPAT